MVALSWPLWIDLADFPAVPFVRSFPDYPRAWSWAGLGLIVAGLGSGMSRRFGRLGVGLTIPVMTWLILGDQLRFQPWIYQFLVLGTLLVVLPPRSALAFGGVWMASVYLHSGLSKLDASFAREMGPLFVRTLARSLGGLRLSPAVRRDRPAPMPAAEILIAVLLLFRPTRPRLYLGTLLIHALVCSSSARGASVTARSSSSGTSPWPRRNTSCSGRGARPARARSDGRPARRSLPSPSASS